MLISGRRTLFLRAAARASADVALDADERAMLAA